MFRGKAIGSASGLVLFVRLLSGGQSASLNPFLHCDDASMNSASSALGKPELVLAACKETAAEIGKVRKPIQELVDLSIQTAAGAETAK